MRADYTFRIDQVDPSSSNDATVSRACEKSGKKIWEERMYGRLTNRKWEGGLCLFFQKAPGCYFYRSDCDGKPADGEYYPAHNARYCVTIRYYISGQGLLWRLPRWSLLEIKRFS